jgi:S1-C subfamily serine protease
LILALNGEPIQTTRQLRGIVAGMSPGQRADLLVLRAGRNPKVSVVLGARPR